MPYACCELKRNIICACTLKSYDVLKVKNALVKSVQRYQLHNNFNQYNPFVLLTVHVLNQCLSRHN